jgi:hypothetical protein
MANTGIAIGVIVVIIILIGAAYYLSRSSTTPASTISTTGTTAVTTAAATAAATTAPPSAVPLLTKFSSTSVAVNAIKQANAVVSAPDGVNISVMIPAGTYALVDNSTLQAYNFTIATFNIANVSSPPGYTNQTPAYGFAFEVNGAINPAISFVNATGSPVHLTTVTHYPNTWYSWAYVGGAFNASAGTYTGGNYLIENAWSYNATSVTMTNVQFYKPIMWIFTFGPANAATTTVAAAASNSSKTSVTQQSNSTNGYTGYGYT